MPPETSNQTEQTDALKRCPACKQRIGQQSEAGKARMLRITPERRSEIASIAGKVSAKLRRDARIAREKVRRDLKRAEGAGESSEAD